MPAAEVLDLSVLAACDSCKLQVPLSQLTQKAGRSKKVCRGCYAVSVTLLRNGISLDASLDESSIEAFYKSCAEERVRNPKDKLTYQKVRAQVKQQLVRKQTRAWSQKSGGPYLPLSMWKQRGLTEEELANVELKGAKRDHAILGATYQVPIDDETFSRTFEEAEEKLLTLETNFKKRKLAKAKAKGTAKGKAAAEPAAEVDEEAKAFSDLESGDEVPAPAASKDEEKTRKAEERKAERLSKKRFAQVTAALGKSLPGLRQQQEKLQKLSGGLNLQTLPAAVQEELAKVTLDLQRGVEEGGQVLARAGKGDVVWKLDDPFFYDASDVTDLVKNVGALLKTLSAHKRGEGGAEAPAAKKPRKDK